MFIGLEIAALKSKVTTMSLEGKQTNALVCLSLPLEMGQRKSIFSLKTLFVLPKSLLSSK